MQNGNVLITRINKNPCPVSNSHQHHFEYDEVFRCRLCGFWLGVDNSNFLYLKRKMDRVDAKFNAILLKQRKSSIPRTFLKKKVKPVIQDGKDLTQKEAFLAAYVKGGKKWFLTNEPVPIEMLTASNFAHILSKKQFKWFKYYWKNIRILPSEVHHILDQGTKDQVEAMFENFTPQEKHNWDRLLKIKSELENEYRSWIKTNPKEYKL